MIPKEAQGHVLDFIFAKARRAKRAVRSYQRLLRLSERKIKPAINEWLEWTAKELREGLNAMRGKTPAAKVKSLADWDKIKERGQELLKPILFELLQAGGDTAVQGQIRKQERFDPIGIEAVKWAENHSAELVVEITEETMLAIREYIITGVNEGKSIQKISMELRPLVGLTEKDIMAVANYHEMLILERPEYTAATQRGMAETYAGRLHRRRAVTIARTESAFALAEGQRQGYDQMDVKNLEWVADPEACEEICAPEDGKIYTIEEAEGMLPAHPNCLLGDSFVLPGGRIAACTKRRYEGKIIIFETSLGHKLACTPNHPIFTDQGLFPADKIDIGRSIICHISSQGKTFIDWKDQYKPTSIENIFSSFSKSQFVAACEVPISSEDFHGDGGGGKVDIIRSDSFLVNRFYSPRVKHLLKFFFEWREIRRISLDRLRMFQFCFKRNLSSTSSLMSSIYLSPPLFGGHSLPAQQPNLTPISYVNPRTAKSIAYSGSGNTKFQSKRSLRLPSDITSDNLLSRQAQSKVFCKSTLISKNIQFYSGHVYNLETQNSYYIVNGIASHNCECSWVAAE